MCALGHSATRRVVQLLPALGCRFQHCRCGPKLDVMQLLRPPERAKESREDLALAAIAGREGNKRKVIHPELGYVPQPGAKLLVAAVNVAITAATAASRDFQEVDRRPRHRRAVRRGHSREALTELRHDAVVVVATRLCI